MRQAFSACSLDFSYLFAVSATYSPKTHSKSHFIKMLSPLSSISLPHICLCSSSRSFQYCLEASMSLRPRQGEGPMAYLNRGQFYPLTLSRNSFTSSLCQPRGKVRVSGPMPSHRSDGSPSSSEQCTKGGSELQRDSIVQVREGIWRGYVEVDINICVG